MVTKKNRRKGKLRERAGTGHKGVGESPSFDGENNSQQQEFRMGQGASAASSESDEEVVGTGGPPPPRFHLDLPSHPNSETKNQELPPQLAELSDHLLRKIIQTDLSLANHRRGSSGHHSHHSSSRGSTTASSAHLRLETAESASPPRFHPNDSPSSGSSRNRTEPTTRSSSPSPSEEGQEVVHGGRARRSSPRQSSSPSRSPPTYDDGDEMDELSSIDTTTGADVGLADDDDHVSPSPSPSPSPPPTLVTTTPSKAGFFEEKKDEDRASGPEMFSRKSRDVDEAEESLTDNDSGAFRRDGVHTHDDATGTAIALTPARQPHRRPSHELISSSDSGFYTASQSSGHVRRASHDVEEYENARSARRGARTGATRGSPTSLGYDDDDDGSVPGTDPTGLLVLGYPPQPELEDDDVDVDDDDDDEGRGPTELSDADDRTDDAVHAGSSGSRSDLSRDSPSPSPFLSKSSSSGGPRPRPRRPPPSAPLSLLSSSPSLAPKALRRTSEYDSLVASLQSSKTFESARIRLAPPAAPERGIDDDDDDDDDGVNRDGDPTGGENAAASAMKGPSSLLTDTMGRNSQRSSSSTQLHSNNEVGIELAQAPGSVAAHSSEAARVAAPAVLDSAINDTKAPDPLAHSDTPLDEVVDEPVLPVVKGSMSEEVSEADDPSVASEEGRTVEPHWLLRSEPDEGQDPYPHTNLPLEPSDDDEGAFASQIADKSVFGSDSDDSQHGATYATQNDSTDDAGLSNVASAEMNATIERKSSGESRRDGASLPESSPLIASSSPDSEPGYVLLGGQPSPGDSHQDNPKETPSVEETTDIDDAPPGSTSSGDLMNGQASDHAPPGINAESKDRLSIPPLRDDRWGVSRPASTDEVPQSFMDNLNSSSLSNASSASLSPSTAKANAIAAAAAAIQGHLQKMEAKPVDSQKIVKTIQGSPTLAERKAKLYTPRKAGKRDPETVLQLKERQLIAIESADESDDDEETDLSLLTPRQLDRSLIGNRSRSMASCDSRSVTSDQGPTSPAMPCPVPKPAPCAVGDPAQSLRENLKRQDSEPVPRVVSKENETFATLSTASLHTPSSTSSSMIFRTPISLSKRLPSDPKRMSDLIRLDLWSRDPDVVESALRDLVKFASESKNHGTMARTGGLLAVVRAMETHLEHGGVQVQACRCLEKLALDHDNELAIGEVGGIEAILGAMMSHCDDCRVQEAAWAALWNLTCGNADNQLVVDAAGGIEVLVQCMVRHGDHPDVQKNACGTLANLCLDNEERLTALAEAGGFVAISAALQRHWRNPDVRNEASYAMTILLGPQAESYDVPVAHAPQQKPNIDA